ncbi:MAG TPA: hypothetical protein VFD73_23635, partial [Gemmatimonadales bacterium]|nr:hypothetical protein [Gemmatimonadales bacterium]
MQRRAALNQPTAVMVWNRNWPSLTQASSRSDRLTVKKLVAINPQAAREHGLEGQLGRWGESFLAGREQEAAEALRIAGSLGDALSDLGGDQSLQSSVETIRKALDRRDRDELLCLARAHQDLREGSSFFQRLAFERAAPRLRKAHEDLARSGSIASLWAAMGLAGVDLYSARYEQAARGFQELIRQTAMERYPALRGRARWGLGMTRSRQGLLAEALAQFQEAARHFSVAGETENLGAVGVRMAETFRFLGQDDAAWAHRHRALRGLLLYPSSRRLHDLLWESADAALEIGEPRVALVLQDEGVGVAERSRDALILAEALIRRSRVRLEAGQAQAARQDLNEASRQNRP